MLCGTLEAVRQAFLLFARTWLPIRPAHISCPSKSKPTHSHILLPLHSASARSQVLAVRASRRLLVVALEAQLMAVDARSLATVWSVVTYAVPRPPGPPDAPAGAVPLALGARWLAYAANQARPLL